MKKLLSIILSVLVSVIGAHGQVTVKKDISKDYPLLPAMPVSLEQAYKGCHCKMGGCNADSLVKPLKQSVESDAKAIGTLSTLQSSDVKNGTAMAKKMQNDGVNNMNDNQKLDYVKNNPQLNNGNANAVAFAQKMKNDPAEKARLQSMTPDQKIAYLQQNGMLQPNVPQNSMSTPASSNEKVADAMSKQQQMQDSETNPSMNKLIRLMENQLNSSALDSAHSKIDKQMNNEIKALPSENKGEASGPSRATVKAVEKKYMHQHIDLATKEMMDMEKTFNALSAKYTKAEAPFCDALAAAGYGYNADGSQDANITKLASGQVVMLNNVEKMIGYSKSIYEFAANWWDKFLRTENEK